MAKPTSGRKGRTIGFEPIVDERLAFICRKNGTTPSKFVNYHIGKIIMDEKEMLRAQARKKNKELQELLFRIKLIEDAEEAEQKKQAGENNVIPLQTT